MSKSKITKIQNRHTRYEALLSDQGQPCCLRGALTRGQHASGRMPKVIGAFAAKA